MVNGYQVEQMIFGGLEIGIQMLYYHSVLMYKLDLMLLKFMEVKDVVMDKIILDSQEMVVIKNPLIN
jgi:hypothetical protein